MANRALTVVILFLFSQFMIAQVYFNIDCGYSLPAASQNLTSKINIGNSKNSYGIISGSLGKGFYKEITVGKTINSMIAFELCSSFLSGSKYYGSFSEDLNAQNNLTIYANMFRIIPVLKFTTTNSRVNLFAKFGVGSRIAGKITVVRTDHNIPKGSITESVTKYSHGGSICFLGAIGTQYSLNNRLGLYLQICTITQSWAPKESEIVKYTINGNNMLETLQAGQKHTTYKDHYEASGSGSSVWTSTQQMKQYFPFSSIGINFGIQYQLKSSKTGTR
jgi:hypothetical protein